MIIEVIDQRGVARRLTLEGDRATVGRHPRNQLCLEDDELVSRLHAEFERRDAAWIVVDHASTHGTWLNGVRLATSRAVHDGDEIIVGRTRLRVRNDEPPHERLARTVEKVDKAPPLTPRERDLLIHLCAPLLRADDVAEPASVAELMERMHVTEDAIKKHLTRLYGKFGLFDSPGSRRRKLAAEAIHRRAVSFADVQDHLR